MFAPEDIRLVAFDMNAIAYAAAYQPNLAKLEHKGSPTGVIHGAMNSFLSAAAAYPGALPVVLWDGHAAWRRAHCPGYKANRSDSPEKIAIKEQVKAQVPAIQLLLQALGVPQARHPDAEADDLAGCIARQAQRAATPTRFASPDSDWWQGINELVDWENPRDGTIIDLETIRAVTKMAPPDGWAGPQEYISAKIIAGDTSDNIPGIQGAGLPTAAKILRTAPRGLDGLLEGDFTAKGVVADRLRAEEGRELVRSNRQIMDWTRAPVHNPNTLALWAYPESISSAREICAEFGLTRLGARLQPGMVKGLSQIVQPAWDVVTTALNWPAQARDEGEGS